MSVPFTKIGVYRLREYCTKRGKANLAHNCTFSKTPSQVFLRFQNDGVDKSFAKIAEIQYV